MFADVQTPIYRHLPVDMEKLSLNKVRRLNCDQKTPLPSRPLKDWGHVLYAMIAELEP